MDDIDKYSFLGILIILISRNFNRGVFYIIMNIKNAIHFSGMLKNETIINKLNF